jgi:Fic-DOC domain mobile mystery protein B
MNDKLLPVGDGQTELSEEDRLGLIPSYIATRGELFDAEQRNIVEALLRPPPSIALVLDDKYLRDLHKAMFGAVWTWAGEYRQRETNIGIDPVRVSTEVRTLVDDARAWVEYGSYERDELCVRFHHRLVHIHPFVNGNGRHGRVAADYLVASLGGDRFTWGAGSEVSTDELRTAYRRALEVADQGEVAELVGFARA